MIKIKRPYTTPAIFNSLVIKKFKKDLQGYYDTYSRNNQDKAPWPTNSTVNKVLLALLKVFPNKCAYCESTLETRGGTFDHFRPSNSARGFGKEYSEAHYWWLSFHWQNLLLACPSCNRAKSSWFPVKGKRAVLKATIAQVRKENALLIDPTIDDPRLHVRFDREGKIIGITEKGSTTIEILQLNRKELIINRQMSVKENEIFLENILMTNGNTFKEVLNHAFRFLIDLFENSKVKHDYLAYKRSYFFDLINEPRFFEILLSKNHLSRNQTFKRKQEQLQKLLNNYKIARFKIPVAETKRHSIERRIQIETVSIRNFKGINHLQFDMPSPGREKKSKIINEPWMVLLGENGVGKSSVLQAICLALCGQNYIDRMKLKPSDLIRIPAHSEKISPVSADIELAFKGEQEDILVHITEQKIHSSIRQPAGYVLAYGSFRIPNSRRLKAEVTHSTIRCQNLFFQDTSLIDYNNWLCSLNEIHFNRVALALKDLMLLNKNDLIIRDRNVKKVMVNKDHKKIPIDLLSDGYRSVFAMACDIMEKSGAGRD